MIMMMIIIIFKFFYFIFFLFRAVDWADYVSFWALVKIARRIVSYGDEAIFAVAMQMQLELHGVYGVEDMINSYYSTPSSDAKYCDQHACQLAYLKNYVSEFHQIFFVCCFLS